MCRSKNEVQATNWLPAPFQRIVQNLGGGLAAGGTRVVIEQLCSLSPSAARGGPQ